MQRFDQPSSAPTRTGSQPVRTHTSRRPGLALASWLAVVASTLLVLLWLGTVLPPPPTSPSEAGAWLDAHGAIIAASSVLRLAAVAVAAALLVTTTLAIGSHLVGNARAIRWTGVLLTPRQRRLVGTALGLGLTLTSTTNAAWASTPPVMQAVTEPIEAPPPASPPPPPSIAATPTTIEVMELVTPAAVPPPHAMATPTATATPTVPVPVPTWTIRPGDHLWGVSEAVLTTAERTPTDAEVARYLHQLVDRNQSILAVPGNADLVYPGQVFTLPDVPASI